MMLFLNKHISISHIVHVALAFIQLSKLTFAILTKWLRISARIFSVWAVKISLTSQKLTWNIGIITLNNI